MTIVLSLPALGNVSTLMLLFLIIFSVLNTNLYWMVYYSPWFELSQDQSSVLAFDSHRATSGLHGLPDGTGVWPLLNSSLPKLAFDEVFFAGAGSTSYGDGISRHANFENFGSSMLTLARCVTGESFNGVMHTDGSGVGRQHATVAALAACRSLSCPCRSPWRWPGRQRRPRLLETSVASLFSPSSSFWCSTSFWPSSVCTRPAPHRPSRLHAHSRRLPSPTSPHRPSPKSLRQCSRSSSK